MQVKVNIKELRATTTLQLNNNKPDFIVRQLYWVPHFAIKKLLVETEPFNITLNDFGAKKSARHSQTCKWDPLRHDGIIHEHF